MILPSRSEQEITALDLKKEAEANPDHEYFRGKLDDGQLVEVLWLPKICRGGVAMGGDATWSDASDPADLLNRVINGDVSN